MRCLNPLVLVPLVLLGGCAGLSERDCRGGDWYNIGVRDGANGRAEEYVAEHSAACQTFGVEPDHDAWLEGRERGLERYCTVRNGYRIGEVGGSYNDVCFAGAEMDFRRGYDLGLRMNRARSALNRVENEIRTVEGRLASMTADKPATDGKDGDKGKGPTDQERQYLQQRLRQLEYERGYLKRDVDDLEWRGRSL